MTHNKDPALTGRGTRRHVVAKRPARPVEPTSSNAGQAATALRGLKDKIAWLAIDDLKPFPHNPRHHPRRKSPA
jgi:hypothetical protein